MVFRVLRIGVDFRGLREFEPGSGGERFHGRFAHVSGSWVFFPALIRAVLDDAENAARFQRAIERLEIRLRLAGARPVMHVAEGEDDIGRSGRRDVKAVAEHGDVDLAVEIFVGIGILEFLNGLSGARARRGIALRGVIGAATGLQIGRQNLGVPAPARPNLDDAHAGLNAEKRQRLLRVAPGVARFFLRRAVLTGDGGGKERDGVRRRGGRRLRRGGGSGLLGATGKERAKGGGGVHFLHTGLSSQTDADAASSTPCAPAEPRAF